MIGNLLIPPTVIVETENLAHDFGGRRVNFIDHIFCVDEPVAVGDSTDPLTILLTAIDHLLDLFGSIGDGHFIHQKLELNEHPVISCGIVNIIANRNDTHTSVTKSLKLQKTKTITA